MARTNEDSFFKLESDYTANARPTTVSYPLEEFWLERFIIDKTSRGGQTTPTFNLEGLAECWMPYGSGQRMCLGRHFAKNEIIGTLGLLLRNFDCHIVDMHQTDKIRADERWVPYGTLSPKGTVAIRLWKRQQ
ncbi:cytochrome p450 [Hirsutella rhossiliensis]|uniref:Cytochrome p450 domain-containing protein n=1 Tax=Hirsutella rhossiliensis TaxID=111463 RepID=A0A9P8MXE6_9HYPO|nr:cytochrome p450 domain-containing protein [Hirsutella rhossiliensis]KAH0962159.1 cytochrome p450 domain-containing protein [Hirsutella rhossiliensis]